MMLALKTKVFFLFLLVQPFLFCQETQDVEPSLVDIENAVMNIVEKVKDSVVSIEFCGNEKKKLKHSGVILNSEGYIVTIATSLNDVSNVCVKTNDGNMLTANVIGIDQVTNIAVIKVDSPEQLTSAIKGDSSKLKLGSFLISIGNPYGLESSPSLGIVSGLERVVKLDEKLLIGLIQTTAAINPGDAGGLTVDSRGNFVGIICSTLGNFEPFGNAIVAPQGINFVIPSNTVCWVSEQLIQFGKVNRGRIGITVKDDDLNTGVVILEVLENSPAKSLGLEKGDRLLKVNGSIITSAQYLVQLVHHKLAGEKIHFEVWIEKEKQIKSIEITLEDGS